MTTPPPVTTPPPGKKIHLALRDGDKSVGYLDARWDPWSQCPTGHRAYVVTIRTYATETTPERTDTVDVQHRTADGAFALVAKAIAKSKFSQEIR